MAQQQWQIAGMNGQCTTTGRVFEEGEEFYTVLFEADDTFRRADFSLEAWEGPPEGRWNSSASVRQ